MSHVEQIMIHLSDHLSDFELPLHPDMVEFEDPAWLVLRPIYELLGAIISVSKKNMPMSLYLVREELLRLVEDTNFSVYVAL